VLQIAELSADRLAICLAHEQWHLAMFSMLRSSTLSIRLSSLRILTHFVRVIASQRAATKRVKDRKEVDRLFSRYLIGILSSLPLQSVLHVI
jgi:hypothetical protein